MELAEPITIQLKAKDVATYSETQIGVFNINFPLSNQYTYTIIGRGTSTWQKVTADKSGNLWLCWALPYKIQVDDWELTLHPLRGFSVERTVEAESLPEDDSSEGSWEPTITAADLAHFDAQRKKYPL